MNEFNFHFTHMPPVAPVILCCWLHTLRCPEKQEPLPWNHNAALKYLFIYLIFLTWAWCRERPEKGQIIPRKETLKHSSRWMKCTFFQCNSFTYPVLQRWLYVTHLLKLFVEHHDHPNKAILVQLMAWVLGARFRKLLFIIFYKYLEIFSVNSIHVIQTIILHFLPLVVFVWQFGDPHPV